MHNSVLQEHPLDYVPQGYYRCKRCERLLLLREEPPENRYWPRRETTLEDMCPYCVVEYDAETLDKHGCEGRR